MQKIAGTYGTNLSAATGAKAELTGLAQSDCCCWLLTLQALLSPNDHWPVLSHAAAEEPRTVMRQKFISQQSNFVLKLMSPCSRQ